MIEMKRSDIYAIKKYFMDKLLSGDLSINNVYERVPNGIEIIMIPTSTPKENLVVIPSSKKIGLMYTKTVLFDSRVFSFIASGFTEDKHYGVYLDGISLIDTDDRTLEAINDAITKYREVAVKEADDIFNERMYTCALRIM